MEQGSDVMLVGRSEDKLRAAKDELASLGNVETVSVDLYDQMSVDVFIKQLAQDAQHIRFLVNSVGYFKPTSFVEHSKEDFDKQLDLNRGNFFVTQAIVRNMQQHGGGRIVNIGSMWAKQASRPRLRPRTRWRKPVYTR